MAEVIIFSKKNGSTRIIIDGEIKLKLCRCGKSKNMPLCDSTHKEIGFEADESEIRINVSDNIDKTETQNPSEP
ncbi:MAG: CDGSH iron-sulfur domain-containing protein [Candidatus Micrarchaeaceae archaeon]|jgi:CDGSH-type Zn-finger protein